MTTQAKSKVGFFTFVIVGFAGKSSGLKRKRRRGSDMDCFWDASKYHSKPLVSSCQVMVIRVTM